MSRVVLVQCTGQKRDEPAPARDLYDESDYFVKQRTYAESVADRWFIQSAKYGLVTPNQIIEPYDVRARDLADASAWAEEVADGLTSHVGRDSTVEILGGRAYADPLIPHLERCGFDVIEPLDGLRIGERKARLVEVVG